MHVILSIGDVTFPFLFVCYVRFYEDKSVAYWAYCLKIAVEKIELQKILLGGGNIHEISLDSTEKPAAMGSMKEAYSNAKSAFSKILPFAKPVEVDVNFLSSGNVMKRGANKETAATGGTAVGGEGPVVSRNDSVHLLCASKTFGCRRKELLALKKSKERLSAVKDGDDDSSSDSSSSSSDEDSSGSEA